MWDHRESEITANSLRCLLSKFASRKGLKLKVVVEVSDVSEQDVEEMIAALMDLGLDNEIEIR